MPNSENFDDLTVPNLPSGWTTQDVNNDEKTWVVSNNNPLTGMYGSHSDPNYLAVETGQANTMND
jgi:hypothetical protein